jgi:hypothetical protein
MSESSLESLRVWLESTAVSELMNWSWWAWPVAESLHFVGLALLIGTVGLFDLRLLGVAKSIPPAALHRLVPWGIAGFVISLSTGLLFFSGIPGMYFYNPAFQAKVVLLLAAGLNVAVFYLTVSRRVTTLAAGESAPLPARLIAGFSLALWIAVLFAGRLIAFYKP